MMIYRPHFLRNLSLSLMLGGMGFSYAADNPAANMELIFKAILEPWHPKNVSIHKGAVAIVSNDKRLTEEIYMAMIRDGVCFSLWLKPDAWSGVKEIEIVNSTRKQGYVFEGGESSCEEMGKLITAREIKQFIQDRTLFIKNFTLSG
ncbi:MAG: hypothetical protein GY862_39155 [Gammaproteobacteria bacterium]|nr:hypothetical protein [Gammaproteobacteria bacterium]